MVDEWVGIRTLLADDPKTKAVLDFLTGHRPFQDWLGVPISSLPRNALCSVTVMGFVRIWALGNSRGFRDGDDVLLSHADFEWIDEVSKVPGLGLAMESVGWAHEDFHEGTKSIRLPNFTEYNIPTEDRSEKEKVKREQNRERQRKFRSKNNGNASNASVTPCNASTEQDRTGPDRTTFENVLAPKKRGMQGGKDSGSKNSSQPEISSPKNYESKQTGNGKRNGRELGANAREQLEDFENKPAKRPDEGREGESIPFGYSDRVWEFRGVAGVWERPDQYGFLARLAWADCAGFSWPRPIMDIVGRCKRARSPAAEITHILKLELGARWEEFLKMPSYTHCLWALEEVENGKRKEG